MFVKSSIFSPVGLYIVQQEGVTCADPRGGGWGGTGDLGFLSNTGLDCLKNHKATKPSYESILDFG